MIRVIKIEEFGIVIEVGTKDATHANHLIETITSDMHIKDEPDKKREDFGSDNEYINELTSRSYYNAITDAIEAMILTHAIEGIDVTSARYIAGIRSAHEAAKKELN